MKIKFSADLDYQRHAVNAVCDLFQGQETCQSLFSVPRERVRQGTMFNGERVTLPASGNASSDEDLGIGNRLQLLDDEILENLRKVQLRNGLAPTTVVPSLDFTVDMETGTGKTYVYLRTALEMNRRYGFTKFIVVVPSIAIREGVFKTLQITEDHFKAEFDNVRYDYFVYDSQSLGDVRTFATSECIQIMVINIDAFRRSFEDPEKEEKAAIIHRPHDRMTGSRPIDFIRATNPIVIIDEPQSVDTTSKSRTAIAALNPLCTLRYSATHKDKHAQVFRLDAVDAYEQNLVKQIEVAGIEVQGGHNRAYLKLVSVDNQRGAPVATIELDSAATGGGVKRATHKVRKGADLFGVSKERAVYDGYVVNDICQVDGVWMVDFTTNDVVLRLGHAVGDVNNDDFKRIQIKRTIEEHLDKEKRLRPLGIKVLSLFFIDKVANYRDYDDDGNPRPGKYARWFEEEYRMAIKRPQYADLFKSVDIETAAEGVHDGYFAVDKKKDSTGKDRLKDSRGDGTAAADESAYRLIMQKKELLLSFDSKLKFIFSHSALREGWDNPNVFQICTLNETTSVTKKRQEIGRGLRIAVNQQGERVHGREVNMLTVMANESYREFATLLQKEYEEEGFRFGILEKHAFANLGFGTPDGGSEELGVDRSAKLWEHLRAKGYVDGSGKVQDTLRKALAAGTVEFPADLPVPAEVITSVLKKVAGNVIIRDANERARATLNKQVFLSPEFKELWDRIKHRTTYRVHFDPERLIEACVKEIDNAVEVSKTRFVVSTSEIDVTRGGVLVKERNDSEKSYRYDAKDFVLPDIVTFLQNETQLTRRTVATILTRCSKLHLFVVNPQRFVEQVMTAIRTQMQLALVDGIKYERIGEEAYYAQELFDADELRGYLTDNMVPSKKAIFDQVLCDSDVEANIAQAFEKSGDVRVYAKLPDWFKIETPLGGYNPDWAVLIARDGEERLYFVVETKSSTSSTAIREVEQRKIACGKAHFAALEAGIGFHKVESFANLQDIIG